MCSRRFWIAPSEERWDETFLIAASIVSIDVVAFFSESTLSPSIPNPAALIDSIVTEILLFDALSEPTWRLNSNGLATPVSDNVIVPSDDIVAFAFTSSPRATLANLIFVLSLVNLEASSVYESAAAVSLSLPTASEKSTVPAFKPLIP